MNLKTEGNFQLKHIYFFQNIYMDEFMSVVLLEAKLKSFKKFFLRV